MQECDGNVADGSKKKEWLMMMMLCSAESTERTEQQPDETEYFAGTAPLPPQFCQSERPQQVQLQEH